MKVAVLGLGSAGRRHAANVEASGHEVLGADPHVPGSLAAEEAIAGADAVIVASPSSFHAEQAEAGISAGTPVLVEKPLATSAAAAAALVEHAERASVPLAVAMNLRFHPAIVELKRLADEGSLGDVRFASASFGYDLRCWRPGTDYRTSYSARSALGGGIVFDAIHELDYLLWILGAVDTVTALAARVSDLEIDVEDVAVAALRFRTGAIGTVDLNFFEPAYRRTCVLVGSSASAAWDWNEGAIRVRAGAIIERIDVAYDVSTTYRDELEDFLEVVRAGKQPRTAGREAVAALEVAEAIKLSAAEARYVTISTA